MAYIVHLGLKIQEKESNNINKELYLSAKPEGMMRWTEEDCRRRREQASYNYDLNMQFFDTLNYEEFCRHINEKCNKFGFRECVDLHELIDVSGIYMLVLDGYKQVYIGQTQDMKRRIMQHWNNRKSLDRLIFGFVWDSVLSIDSFGALDTTRVFYIRWEDYKGLYRFEEKIVDEFDRRYILNRTAGGIGYLETNTADKSNAILAAAAHRKKRDFVQFIDRNKVRKLVHESDFDLFMRKYPE